MLLSIYDACFFGSDVRSDFYMEFEMNDPMLCYAHKYVALFGKLWFIWILFIIKWLINIYHNWHLCVEILRRWVVSNVPQITHDTTKSALKSEKTYVKIVNNKINRENKNKFVKTSRSWKTIISCLKNSLKYCDRNKFIIQLMIKREVCHFAGIDTK